MDSPIVNASVSGMTKDAAILVNPAGNASSYTASVGSQKSNDPQQKVGAVNAEQVQKSIQKLQEILMLFPLALVRTNSVWPLTT